MKKKYDDDEDNDDKKKNLPVSADMDFLNKLQTILTNQNAAIVNQVATLGNSVGELTIKVDGFYDWQRVSEQRLDNLENEEEITTQQKRHIRATAAKQVYSVLGLPPKKKDWSVSDHVVYAKYHRLFFKRCYIETSWKGHLASPYEETTRRNYTDAIKDIEAWTPLGGVAGLMREADENAAARLEAKREGY